ncbi:MAG: hypothetical protein ACRDUV_02110 [Pseudonocardiaceae bacterium]
MKSTEQIARSIYEALPTRDKRVVLAWRQLGNDWCTSVLNSGVMRASGQRTTPHDAARQDLTDQYEQLLLDQQRRIMGSDQRRETAEHEAAHAIVADALGLKVRVAYIGLEADGSGGCIYERGTPFDTATVAMAGEMWIGVFRSDEFLGGPRGCGPDHLEHSKAYYRCFHILQTNGSAVMALADRLDQDGNYLPCTS